MSKVIIHIGHQKTGSSFLQTKMAQNVDNLKGQGFLYPHHYSFERASKGAISSGNGMLLLDEDYVIPEASKATVYSSEILFKHLLKGGIIDNISSKLSKKGRHLTVVLYTRDLFEHSFSSWGQYIKRGRGTASYTDFVGDIYGDVYELTNNWMSAAKRAQFELKIYNYSRHKKYLFRHFLSTVLEVDHNDLFEQTAEEMIVNRSLSLSECELQRLFNIHYPRDSSAFVSDGFVNELPNIKSEKPGLDGAVYQLVVERLEPPITKINLQLDTSEKIIIKPLDDLNESAHEMSFDNFLFHQSQLELFVKSVAQKIDSKACLESSDADYLRNIAVKIEMGRTLNLQDAYVLMSLAQRARPNGPFINQKLKEYTARLRQK